MFIWLLVLHFAIVLVLLLYFSFSVSPSLSLSAFTLSSLKQFYVKSHIQNTAHIIE